MPSFERLGLFYPPTYHAATARGLLPKLRHQLRGRHVVKLVKGEGAVLDYGCGNGAFLSWAQELLPFRPLVGYEIGKGREILRLAEGRLTIVRGAPEDLMEVLPPCRLITMNHVIEHLPDPFTTLARLVTRLVPGGWLEGQTPAAQSLEHRVFGTHWSGYHAPRHTVVFSRQGLRRLLERVGLTEVEVSAAFNPASLAVSLAALAGRRRPGKGIPRAGLGWLGWLGCATLLAPIDLASGSPGIVNFKGVKR
jgi:hypothetical protein